MVSLMDALFLRKGGQLKNASDVVSVAKLVASRCTPLDPDNTSSLQPLIDRIKDCKVVMLGEASHGTHEFYEWRSKISKLLIEQHGFNFIGVEGDWPACQTLNEYSMGFDPKATLGTSLKGFSRWPTWMWANREILNLARWLRKYNDAHHAQTKEANEKIGFYGLDVYSLFDSIDSVLNDMEVLDPDLTQKLKDRYDCFGSFDRDEQAYARSLRQYPSGCFQQAVSALTEVLKVRLNGMAETHRKLFDAKQNARIVLNAERYYRAMIGIDEEDSWNVRDRHMHDTLTMLLRWHGPNAKAIVWAHNTHIGDYNATDMAARGEVNIGGLAREAFGAKNVALVGFGTHRGTVIASGRWDGRIQRLEVPSAREGSYEDIMHRASELSGNHQFAINFGEDDAKGPLSEWRGHRAIGVVYHPDREKYGNYVPTSLAQRYDSFVFVDNTRALHWLPHSVDHHDVPETYPFAE